MTRRPIRVLFVCLGNICRSPLAEGAFRQAATLAGAGEAFLVDSAGISDFHAGEPPDSRAVRIARERGYDISARTSRPVRAADFTAFDYLLAMDRSNLAALSRLRPPAATAWSALLLDAALGRAEDVPDPYTGTAGDFTRVAELVEEAAQALVPRLIAGR
ncbi:low molecular weight protein-tyrosine-phosphatase [Pseudoxanthobacter sp.]|uniref:low molecular weight protein-tyrosine-phosphatase n=1 Tax=Pseudoxanthobacter sp. TaxID=1925742 RepID=UPI002FE2EBB6